MSNNTEKVRTLVGRGWSESDSEEGMMLKAGRRRVFTFARWMVQETKEAV